MRRAIVMAAALAVIPIVPAATAGSVGAQQCTQRLNYRTARYKAVATRTHVPVARRLGRGALIGCTITRATAREGGVRRVSVYAVRGRAADARPAARALAASSASAGRTRGA